MSGGVDSSVAALILSERGYRVTGATMKLLAEEEEGPVPGRKSCCSLAEAMEAREVCNRLDIDHLVLNFTLLFREEVIRRFAQAYARGLTPNPCIDCNRYLKFGHLWDRAKALGCQAIATGHYARVHRDGRGRWRLCKALDKDKDQSYVLYSLSQEELSRTLFPLGELTKAQVRKIAGQRGLSTAQKAESQDICFVRGGSYRDYLERGQSPPPGDILDREGRAIGRHLGIHRYTVGQRRGLSIPGPRPLYVLALDPAKNAVIAGPEEDLYRPSAAISGINLIGLPALDRPMEVMARIRYRQAEFPARLWPGEAEGTARLEFSSPQKGVSPGQAAVFYRGEEVLGGGTICP
jgi:tRNA-specific 2-thiouridylase